MASAELFWCTLSIVSFTHLVASYFGCKGLFFFFFQHKRSSVYIQGSNCQLYFQTLLQINFLCLWKPYSDWHLLFETCIQSYLALLLYFPLYQYSKKKIIIFEEYRWAWSISIHTCMLTTVITRTRGKILFLVNAQ